MYVEILKTSAGARKAWLSRARAKHKAKVASVLSDMSQLVKRKGGFTYSPSTNHSPKEGMAVSPYPEHTKLVPLKDFSADHIAEYMVAKAAMLKDTANHVGAWVHEGNVFLDVVIVAKNHAKAVEVCKSKDQIAYFDLKTGKEVIVNKDAKSGGVVQ